MDALRLPLFDELAPAQRVLVAGAGGGFDVFCGLPLYFALREAGKQVFLANLSFSNLPPTTAGLHLTPVLVEVTADSEGSKYYFPEKHLSEWFRSRGEEVSVYAFHRTGTRPIAEAYRALASHLQLDTIILVDGGTDSLMRGDEQGLGTPQEDMASIAAVDQLSLPRKLLVCLGFGIDTFHGVCHAHVLEAVADLTRARAYLGAFSLTSGMPAVQLYREATQYVLEQTPGRESIVSTSILSAIEGQFGNFHRTDRTEGSELFINPLMSIYWAFRLDAVARRIAYLDRILDAEGYHDVTMRIKEYQSGLADRRPWSSIPL